MLALPEPVVCFSRIAIPLKNPSPKGSLLCLELCVGSMDSYAIHRGSKEDQDDELFESYDMHSQKTYATHQNGAREPNRSDQGREL